MTRAELDVIPLARPVIGAREEELVLVDAGCELLGYASDVTRTYPIGGRFTGPARAIYEVVLASQEAALAQCRPGRTLPDVHDAAVRQIVAGLLELGLLKGDLEELIAREAYRPYYMHSTSHWLPIWWIAVICSSEPRASSSSSSPWLSEMSSMYRPGEPAGTRMRN